MSPNSFKQGVTSQTKLNQFPNNANYKNDDEIVQINFLKPTQHDTYWSEIVWIDEDQQTDM